MVLEWSFDANLEVCLRNYLVVDVDHLVLHGLNLTGESFGNRIDKSIHLIDHVMNFLLYILMLSITGLLLFLNLIFKTRSPNSPYRSWLFLAIFGI